MAADGICFVDFSVLFRCALTVELEDEVDDSRTGGKALRAASFDIGPLPAGASLSRRGVLEACVESISEDTMTPLEYDEAELGVGTWLYGESVYLDEGVAECERAGTGGVRSRIGYVSRVSRCGSVVFGMAELR